MIEIFSGSGPVSCQACKDDKTGATCARPPHGGGVSIAPDWPSADGLNLVGRRVVLGIGVFDGVHRGHQLLLERLQTLAAERDALPVALTFDPHPRAVLFPQRRPILLYSLPARLELLRRYGAAATVTVNFTPEFAALSPVEFLNRLLAPPADIVGICVGKHWHFGSGGCGDAEFLAACCAERRIGFQAVPELQLDGEIVSSSNIRRALAAGRLNDAAAMLGRPYRLGGIVTSGHGAATSDLGCPTANLRLDGGVLPPDGVYAARAVTADGTVHPAAVNIGTAPTFNWTDGERRLEVHLLDFAGNLYGAELGVELLRYLRSERTFAGAAELRRQIAADIAEIKATVFPGG